MDFEKYCSTLRKFYFHFINMMEVERKQHRGCGECAGTHHCITLVGLYVVRTWDCTGAWWLECWPVGPGAVPGWQAALVGRG